MLIVIPVVVGSSPIGHPKEINDLAQSFRLGFFVSGFRGYTGGLHSACIPIHHDQSDPQQFPPNLSPKNIFVIGYPPFN